MHAHNTSAMASSNRNNSSSSSSSSSVYHRAKLLAPIFPWLLFSSVLPTLSTTSVAVTATDIASPPLLRGQRHQHQHRHRHQQQQLQSSSPPQPRMLEQTVQNYCGTTWGDANSSCLRPCPSGEATQCGPNEQCFADLTSCPKLTVLSAEELGLPPPQPVGWGDASASTNNYNNNNNGGGGTTAAASSSTNNNNNRIGQTLAFQIGATIPTTCPTSTTNSINVGYYQSWAKYRSPHCHPLRAADIPIQEFGYTHLIYSFAGISSAGLLEPYNGIMEEVDMYNEFNALKSSSSSSSGNAGLVTLIAVGGWTLDQTLFTHAASTPATRAIFATSVVDFIQEYNFDGIDLDWEYPVSRQGSPEDYVNYPLLVSAIRLALDEATTASTAGKKYLLTMAIPINPTKLQEGFDLAKLKNDVDWFHLMSYDIHGAWGTEAGSNTDMNYIEDTIENSIFTKGVGGGQLVFGMASYGRSMKLSNPTSCETAGCPIDGAGMEGCSGEAGFSPYFELKERYVDTRQYESLLINEETKSMEMIVEGGVFVSLDLDVTFEMKREYYLSKCFRGQMWWALDMIKESPFATSSNQVSSTSASNPSPTPGGGGGGAPSPTISLNSAPGVTQDDAYCADTTKATLVPIEDCAGFVFCQNSRMSGSITMCSPGLMFDNNMGICNWPSETNLCGFEFCPNKMSGYVPFEDCNKFYYCKAGKIDGDIDVCPEGTLFDMGMGICNWASMVECNTMAPTPPPTPKLTPHPTFASVNSAPGGGGASEPYDAVATPRPTYGTVTGATAASKFDTSSSYTTDDSVNVATVAGARVDGSNPSAFQDGTARLTFRPTDDAYVAEAKPYGNYNDRFIVADEHQRFDGLLRFYIQGLDHRRVKYVKLRLYVSNASHFGGNFFKSKDNWHEDVVTWDTAPSIIGQKPLAVVHAVRVSEWVEVDLTGLVRKDGPVSLRITSESSDNVMYSSKENPNQNAPELIVGVEPSQKDDGESEDMQTRDAPTVLNSFKIGPTDDAYTHETSSANSFAVGGSEHYGRNADLKVDMNDGVKTAYMRFDLSRVRVEALEKATLRLYATESSSFGGTFVTSSDSIWDEVSITHDNAPPADGIVLGALQNVEKDSWYELDVTAAISESRPLTICILASHDDNVVYSSKDGPRGFGPEMILSLQESIPLVTQGGEVTELLPTDDATVVLQAPDSNFGMTEELRADANHGMHNFLLRFDATDIPRGEVKSAILRIYAKNEDPAFGGTFVSVSDTFWNERTVTWNNAPQGDGQVLGSLMEVEYGSYYDVDVTTAVIGGSPVSFRVNSPHSSEAIYASKDASSHGPRLIIQYKPPDPLPEGFDIYIPTDDASILMDSGDTNFGRADSLRVDGYGGVYNSLLRFDLSSVEKGTVMEAILRLYAVDGSPSGGTFVTTQDSDWSQYDITWNTAPAADGVVLVTLGEVAPYKYYEIDLTKILDDLGGEPLSIRIAPSHGMRCAYSSSQDRLGHLPQLLIKADLFNGME